MESNRPGLEIIIGATCFADANTAIDIAGKLSASLEMQVRAFLLKDVAITYAGALPFARAVSLSGSTTKVSATIMQQAYFKDADAYQKALAAMARRNNVTWTFQELECDVETIFQNNRARQAITLVGFQPIQKNRKGIIIIATESEELSGLEDLANTLAEPMNPTIQVMRHQPGGEVNTLLDGLNRQSPTLLIVTDTIAAEFGINNLIDTGRCPVVISSLHKASTASG